jgi:Putative DNA-binding domain
MNSQNNSTALAQQQRDLLHAIFTTKNIAVQAINTPVTGQIKLHNSYSLRGLQTYQANAAASALRSLQTAFPVIAQLIGEEAFEHLARDFWGNHPPVRGDLAQWGGNLAEFIASIPALQTEPYLSDVARAEWALHACATATDIDTDLTTFALLTDHDPDALTLQLAPGTALVPSHYPIASIFTAHLYDSPSFDEVGQKLRQEVSETALIWRQGLRPRVSSCSAGEAAFIRQLLVGKSLLAALENDELADSTPPFDFQLWLPQAVQTSLLLRILPA